MTTTQHTERLVGFVGEHRRDIIEGQYGSENMFPGAVPIHEVERLMSYPVVEAPVSVGGRELADYKAIMRADTGRVFGIPKAGYAIHSPKQWLSDALSNILDSDLSVGSAALMKYGAVALVQAEEPETRIGAEGARFRPYISAITSHDGSMATNYFLGGMVIACENQFGSIRDLNRVAVRHTRNSHLRVGQVRESLAIQVARAGDEMDQQIRELTSQYVTDQQFFEIVSARTGIEKAREQGGRREALAEKQFGQLRELWEVDDRVAPWRNSAYGVVQAFNTYRHHVATVRGDRFERNLLKAASGEWNRHDQKVLRALERV